jgi:DUF1680 family protein
MCGSLEKSGSDLAYYQGNYGRKIYRTAGGAYQCCRYRGFTLFSYLNDLLYRFDGETLIPMIYTSSEFSAGGVGCTQSTSYPKSGEITFKIKSDRALTLKLRIPAWCKEYSLDTDAELCGGYLCVRLEAGESEVHLTLVRRAEITPCEIDGKSYVEVNYGPLLMAHDTHFGGELWQSLSAGAVFEERDGEDEAMVKLVTDGMTLVDFASAGGNDPENDTYTVFIPKK